ncbi:beta-lactamase family protein [Sphingomonas sp. RP10(2022)]|uniref:Beta-lactamase family protein n=1 Tax=Sphingomonas liriopis TaxID=2949094 RepID=A0A9X2KP85_9SPHN|nr:serine hydrolase domain-containing protein [Sphingomonas liriopis]MCP3733331.1 beta-lactamase family protein [Sphingomonas liriopis]
MPFKTIAALALAITPAAVAAQALTPAELTAIDKVVADGLAATGTPSAQVAIVRGGRIVLTKAYGKQSDTAPARTDAPYQIASISKQFTAAALLLLEDDGKLSMDDTVAKWLPSISGGDKITIRQLLSHTSGLQDYWPQDYSFAAMEKPTTPQAIVDRWAKKPLDFAPGTQWQYSNTGYVVAGLIAEKAAGEPLLALLQRRVFAPLGMTAIDQDKAIGGGFPVGYHRNALGPVRVAPPPADGWLFAAGELSMSAGDLAKWDVARLNRSLLPADDWAAQEKPVLLADGSTTNYGLGVSLGKRGGQPYVEHSGEAVGFLSENIVFPDQKAAIVVLTNADFGDAFVTIAQGLAKIVVPGNADAAEAAKTKAARALFDSLRGGTLDRRLLTANASYYFTPQVLADYRTSLSPLGEPTGFELASPKRLRGGFVQRRYTVTYPKRKLSIGTFAEPDGAERYEQFLVSPAN